MPEKITPDTTLF